MVNGKKAAPEKEGAQTALSRAWRMGRMGFGITGSYLGYQVQNLFLDENGRTSRREAFQRNASRRLREELQELKGPFMKIGQILSMQSHALPAEALRELAALQSQAPAMHPTLARAQFKSAMGRNPEEVFREFEAEPFAAASLGQVHRAVTKEGEKVAVKIQYPAIRIAIQNDFKLVRTATWPGKIAGYVAAEMLEEMETGILQETDYRREARHLEYFRKVMRCVPYVRVPKVHPECSGERVLTMTLLPGVPLQAWVARGASEAQRNEAGTRLMELFNYQLHWLEALHADPNPGNYLFEEDGTIGLIDFGCVKPFSKRFIELMDCFFDREYLIDEQEFERMVDLSFHPANARERARARGVMREAVVFAQSVYPGAGPAAAAIDFRDGTPIRRMHHVWQLALKSRLSNPEFVFAARAEMGMYNLLHELGARVDTTKLAESIEAMAGPRKRAVTGVFK